jgi:uncharacterized membrane protein YedE/YeeE
MGELIAALVAGVLFGVGVVVANVTDPSKVIGFLDVAGEWDPTLILVVGGAVATAGAGNWLLRRRTRPLLAPRFAAAMREVIDRPLLLGAALFGAGWGLSGYCPAPALAGVVLMEPKTWIFVGAMLVGMGIYSWQYERR